LSGGWLFLLSSVGGWMMIPSPALSIRKVRHSLLYSSLTDEPTFLSYFSGDFDNYFQVMQDREEGRFPKEGGGHEHIHCTLIPTSDDTRLAAFYLDGNPQRIFRFRWYRLNIQEGWMKLHTIDPQLETLLRQQQDPTEWPRIVYEYQNNNHNKNHSTCFHELLNCDIEWSSVPDPIQHAYAIQAYPNRLDGYHAIMIQGEAIVDSTMIPGQKILVRDQLSLWKDEFWIHDRGYDPLTMTYIYGNQRGIPYRLERVTTLQEITTANDIPHDDLIYPPTKKFQRVCCRPDLEWTLGVKVELSRLTSKKLPTMMDAEANASISKA
jgi:hypothetical protein